MQVHLVASAWTAESDTPLVLLLMGRNIYQPEDRSSTLPRPAHKQVHLNQHNLFGAVSTASSTTGSH